MDSKQANKDPLHLNVLKTPFCGDLRSKKFYMRDCIATSADDYNDSSGHTWCYNSQMSIGPDGFAVTTDACGPDRKCYRSALEKAPEYVAAKGTFIGRLA